jgi:SAM-dependent methyltransferase
MGLVSRLLEQPIVYRAWQAPFALSKLEPVLRHNDLRKVRRVLDVGCGPGTNAPFFSKVDYLGLDINERYIAYAKRRFGREFVVADVTSWTGVPGRPFDFVLVNSLLHHLDDAAARRLLSVLRPLLSENGCVHLLELVRPEQWGPAKLLAGADRGRYSRSLLQWHTLCQDLFQPIVFEPYSLQGFGILLWKMVYLKGRPIW